MLEFDESDIAEAEQLNRKLAFLPRFQIRSRAKALFLQSFVHLRELFPVRSLQRGEVRVEMRTVAAGGGRVTLRILRPRGAPHGVYLDIHGGGWVLGNARIDDAINGKIAAECGLVVVSVDYRLALDRRVETCIEDCRRAAVWLLDEGLAEFGASRVVIGGESAGAHLAACTLVALKDQGRDLSVFAGAVLFYGVYDLSAGPGLRRADPDTLILHGPTIAENLLLITDGRTPEERRSPRISPLYADLSGMPPALLIVGELDPLLDDSRRMAESWRAAGAEATFLRIPQAPHAFNRLPTRMAEKTNAHVRAWIRERLAARI